MTTVPQTGRSEADAREIVEHVFGVAGRDARERIWQHPFSRRLADGSLSHRQRVGFLYDWCTVAHEVNCASAQYLHRFGDLRGRLPELAEYFSAKLVEEWGEPTVGGHQAVLEALVERLGGSPVAHRPRRLIPEMRGLVDALVWLISTEPIDSSPILIEEWFGDWAVLWIRDLKRRRVPTGANDYWQLHQLADGGSDERGGHRAGNRQVAVRLLQAGLGPADPKLVWVRNSRTSTSLFLKALDGCVERFDESDVLGDLDFRMSGPAPLHDRATQAAARLADDPTLRTLRAGRVPDYVLGPFFLNWRFFQQQLALSFARLPHRFLDAYRGDGARPRAFFARFRDEFPAQTRIRLLRDVAVETRTPSAMLREPWILPETFMLTGFVVRLHSEGTLDEIDALPLAQLFAELARATSLGLAQLGHTDLASQLTRQFVGSATGGALSTTEAYLTNRNGAAPAQGEVANERYIVDVAGELVRIWIRGCLAHFGGTTLTGG